MRRPPVICEAENNRTMKMKVMIVWLCLAIGVGMISGCESGDGSGSNASASEFGIINPESAAFVVKNETDHYMLKSMVAVSKDSLASI